MHRKLTCLIICVLFLGILFSTVEAHFLYLETEDHPRTIPINQEVKIYFGHPNKPETFYEGEHFRIEEACLYKPDGNIEKLILKNEPHNLTSTITLSQKGEYIVMIKNLPSVYNPAWHGGKEPVKLSQSYAKVLIYTGGSENWDKVIGQGVEIIPQVNPHYLRVGDKFNVNFLYEGKPVRGEYAAAHETQGIHDPKIAQIGKTQKDGSFSIELNRSGMWAVTAKHNINKSGVWKASYAHKKGWFIKGEDLKYEQLSYSAIITFWVYP